MVYQKKKMTFEQLYHCIVSENCYAKDILHRQSGRVTKRFPTILLGYKLKHIK